MAVSVEEALELIYQNVVPKTTEMLPIEQVLGRVLAKTLQATHNLPPYDNSAMDGYAVMCADAGKSITILDTIFAGDNKDIAIFLGNAVKIMTGARIPQGCECIVPVENTTPNGDEVILPENLKAGQHIRLCGEDIEADDLLLDAGTTLYAHHIALFASQGISHISVYKRPRVALFASGSELKMHFESVQAHQLYNTNTPSIAARCSELGCEVTFLGTAMDTIEDIHEHIRGALDSDLIITSGGVSVGDADYTKEAFGAFDMETFFDKISIKPGKPTTVGRIGNTMVLHLPGNPLAAALNFEIFGQSIILALSGTREKYLGTIDAVMQEDYMVKSGRRTLIPGIYDGVSFKPCEKFAPGMVSPLGKANGIIMLDETVSQLNKGDTVKIFPTRFSLNQNHMKSLVSSRV